MRTWETTDIFLLLGKTKPCSLVCIVYNIDCKAAPLAKASEKILRLGVPGWLGPLSGSLLVSTPVMISGFWSRALHPGSALSGESVRNYLPPFPPVPLTTTTPVFSGMPSLPSFYNK